VALTGEDYIELMPADWHAIGDGGIQIDYRTYNCGELGPYRRTVSGVAGKGTRWEVHFDPYDVSRIWVRNHHAREGGWITVPWTHQSMVAQPFADFTWRHARKIAAGRGLDDTNETAVAAVLGALLQRAGHGPESRRVLARARAMAALPPALPEEAMPAALPESAAPLALPAAGDPGWDDAPDEDPDEGQEITGTVVGFGLFDPFSEDKGARR
jgi:Mu transposase, C-terminal